MRGERLGRLGEVTSGLWPGHPAPALAEVSRAAPGRGHSCLAAWSHRWERPFRDVYNEHVSRLTTPRRPPPNRNPDRLRSICDLAPCTQCVAGKSPPGGSLYGLCLNRALFFIFALLKYRGVCCHEHRKGRRADPIDYCCCKRCFPYGTAQHSAHGFRNHTTKRRCRH